MGDECFVAEMRRTDDETSFLIQRNADTRQRRIPLRTIGAIQTAQGDMGERLGHTITTPCVTREVLQRLGELLIDGTTANEQMAHFPQPFAFLRHLQRVPYLHGNHCSEEPTPIPSPREESRISLYFWEGIKIPLPWGGGRGGLAAQRVSTWLHAD